MRSLQLPLLLGLALVAGCLSNGDPVETASTDGAAAPPASGNGNATSIAVPALEPLAQTLAISYEGKTGSGACIPTGPTSCTSAPVGTDSENTFYEPEYPGSPTSASLTITWSATTPLTAKLGAGFFAIKSCGENCIEGSVVGEYVTGPSPLTLAAPTIALGENETLAIHVGYTDDIPTGPVPIFWSLEQAFLVEGELVTMVTPTA